MDRKYDVYWDVLARESRKRDVVRVRVIGGFQLSQ